jgi:hypothetical protein
MLLFSEIIDAEVAKVDFGHLKSRSAAARLQERDQERDLNFTSAARQFMAQATINCASYNNLAPEAVKSFLDT